MIGAGPPQAPWLGRSAPWRNRPDRVVDPVDAGPEAFRQQREFQLALTQAAPNTPNPNPDNPPNGGNFRPAG